MPGIRFELQCSGYQALHLKLTESLGTRLGGSSDKKNATTHVVRETNYFYSKNLLYTKCVSARTLCIDKHILLTLKGALFFYLQDWAAFVKIVPF